MSSQSLRATARQAFAAAALLACFAALGVVPVAAQVTGDGGLRRELERTDQVLEEAGRIIRLARDPRPSQLVEQAASLQQIAWEHFRANRPRFALQQTLQARGLARRAIGLVQRPGDVEERATRALEQAERALERARQCAGDPPSDAAGHILDLAAARLEQAQVALREQKFLLAIEISLQVQRLLDDVCGGIGSAQAERLIENVDRLIERAMPDVAGCGNANATDLLQRGRDLQRRAHEQMTTRNYVLAEQSSRQARDLVLRAMRLCEQPPDLTAVDRALEDAGRDLDRVASQVRGSGQPEAVAVLETALEHLARARDLRQRGELRRTLAELRVARNLAARAARRAGIPGF